MKPFLFFLPAMLLFHFLQAQTNVRAWYADGQVWVVWEFGQPLPETYAVFAKPTAFTNTADATQAGRLFKFEYLPAALKEQVDTFATYRIPDGMGSTYHLADNEALFVATPHQTGSLYFAVVAEGETTVMAGVNITDAAVPFSYDPVGDPVECHLQATFPSPFGGGAGYICQAYYLWCDGRQNHWEGRPDFPIMANAAKSGMPGMFLVSIPLDIDTTQAFPLTVWLHGGDGKARQSLAGSRPIVGINPQEGILVAQDDNVIGWRDTVPPNMGHPSWHFGWRKNWDPFMPGNLPTEPDTVINYTQRRYIWVDQWLARRFNVDTTRININGHSMGGAGTTALAKCYPRHYASATVFNNGFGTHEDSPISAIFGAPDDDFYTNLTNRSGGKVRLSQVRNIMDNTSPERDWPPFRVYHSKNDDNGTMRWDAYVVENYRKADSLGMGVQLYWSERAHGIDEGPNWNDHWHNGNAPNQQTGYDNTAFEEDHFRSDESFPAFFNLRLQPGADDPGDGTLGTGPNGVGDDWGTWGGYFRWEDIVTYGWSPNPNHNSFTQWEAAIWMEGDAIFTNDNCPVDEVTTDIAVRKGKPFYCTNCNGVQLTNYYSMVYDIDNNGYIQYPEAYAMPDTVILLKDVKVYREDVKKIRIYVVLLVPTTSTGSVPFTAALQPNPVFDATTLTISHPQQSQLLLQISDVSGCLQKTKTFRAVAGENRIPLEVESLAPGLHFVRVVDENGSSVVLKMIKR